MKINWEMFLTVALAILVVMLIDKFVITKISETLESYESEDLY